jgi:hypothetical protein
MRNISADVGAIAIFNSLCDKLIINVLENVNAKYITSLKQNQLMLITAASCYFEINYSVFD